MLLGPGVLGRLAPNVYRDMFSAPQAAPLEQLYHQDKASFSQFLGDLKSSHASREQVRHRTRLWDRQLAALQVSLQHAQNARAAALAIALILATALTMLIETLLAPDPIGRAAVKVPAALSRLVTVRYALIAAWLAVVIARPVLLSRATIILAAIVALLTLIVGLVPLGPRKIKATPPA